MEDLNLSVQTGEQTGAGPGTEAMPVDPIPESRSARWPTEESTATTGGLGDGERLTPMVNGSAVMPRATVEAAGSSEVDAGVINVAPESRAGRLV